MSHSNISVVHQSQLDQSPPSMRLFLEFFVHDFKASHHFYHTIMRMQNVHYEEDFAQLQRGQMQIHLLSIQELPEALQKEDLAPLASRTEVCLELSNLEEVKAELDYIQSLGWPIEDDLIYRPWNKYDFRIKDPEGVYLRISTPTLSD